MNEAMVPSLLILAGINQPGIHWEIRWRKTMSESLSDDLQSILKILKSPTLKEVVCLSLKQTHLTFEQFPT